MPHRKRAFALILAVSAVLVISASSLSILAHTRHRCTGRECPVCALLCMCEENLRASALSPATGSVSMARLFVADGENFRFSSARPFLSLVSLKVKLSN